MSETENVDEPQYVVPPIMAPGDPRTIPPLAVSPYPINGMPSYTMTDKRVILSLTLRQIEDLVRGLDQIADSYEREGVPLPDPMAAWTNRFARIYDHMIDSVDIHFTDLGGLE